MGFWSSIGSAISSGFDSVCRTVSSIGSSVSKFCDTVLPVVISVIKNFPSVAGTLASVGEALFKSFGIFQKDDEVEKIGDEALQAAEQDIRPENFESHAAYMQGLRDFPLDPKKSADYTPIAKLAAGLAVGTAGLEKKLDVEPGVLGPMWVLPAMDPKFFTPERMTAMLNKTHDFSTIVSYFEGGATPATARNVEGVLVAVEKQIDPVKDIDSIHKDIDAAREQVSKTIEAIKAIKAISEDTNATGA